MKTLKFLKPFVLTLLVLGPLAKTRAELPALNFSELEQASNQEMPGHIIDKLDKLFRSVDVQTTGITPKSNSHPKLGKTMSVVTWNVEKSLNIPQLIQLLKVKESDFIKQIGILNIKKDKKEKIINQRQQLLKADVLILQEMDYGVNRSGYIYAAKDLANALGMNYAYAPNQVEIDPRLMQINMTDKSFEAHKSLYKGLFGMAVLSRYPILEAQSFPLKSQDYNWYEDELKYDEADFIEKTRRFGAETLFEVYVNRELKRGTRNFFRVDLYVPYLPKKRVSVVNVHLEIRTESEGRVEQMEEILSYIKDIDNPVILAGDFNASNSALATYTSAYKFTKRIATNKSNWLSFATTAALPGSSQIINLARNTIGQVRNFNNPLAPHIPFLLENQSRKIFDEIFEFRFNDGRVFDLRGNPMRSLNIAGKASNANQKSLIGYKTSFKTPKTFLHLGRGRIDWFFIKSYNENAKQTKGLSDQPYRFAPHFGQVYTEFNEVLEGRISDHNPMIVHLPFDEPEQLNQIDERFYEKKKEDRRKRLRRIRRK